MELRDIFESISPLDHRYSISNPGLFEALGKHFSEAAYVRACVAVECSLVKTHLERQGESRPEFRDILDGAASAISPETIYEEEKKTRHNIRALVNVLKRVLPEALGPYIHLGATSVDILDTAQSLRIRNGVRKVILPELIRLMGNLSGWTSRYAGLAQVGRTHGQFAVPITLGWTFASYTSRLGKSMQRIEELSLDLRGKIAGAVGSYNATSLLYGDPEEFEKDVLADLGLRPSDHSTQLVEPEHLLRLLLEVNVAFGVVANLADDLRQLQRSEIDELREYFAPDQVGSSTMPQKRNPWNAEHVKSLWKAFAPRVMTFFMDQISEHQRDLTNSASSRFVVEFLSGFTLAIDRMNKILEGMSVNEVNLRANIDKGGASVLAEAAYILLSQQGESDGHEIIRKITLAAETGKCSFLDALKADTEVWKKLERGLEALGIDAMEFFSDPAQYRGRAMEKSQKIAADWSARLAVLSAKLASESV